MDKWTKKYLLVAKTLADDNTACLSRKLGGVLVTKDNIPLTLGYNGSAKGLPHNDSPEWLGFIYDEILPHEDKLKVGGYENLLEKYSGKGICPRKILGVPSGQRLELCNCSHLERNLIYHAAYSGHSTKDSWMVIWSPLPCHECAIAIIQAGIKKVTCIKAERDYSPTSRKMFEWAKIEVEEIDENETK
jgi:deoxycytidylate deaminase